MFYEPPRTLVVSGAGANAIAELSSLHLLRRYMWRSQKIELWDHFTRYRGVSAGALICALLCVETPLAKCASLMYASINSTIHEPIKLRRAYRSAGLVCFDRFRDALWSVFGDMTLGDVHARTGRDLAVGVTDLEQRCFRMLGRHNAPDVRVVDAVIASMSIPLMISPAHVGGNTCVDGGLVVNFPYPSHLWIDTDPARSFGISVINTPASSKCSNWKSVGAATYDCLLYTQNTYQNIINRLHDHPEDMVQIKCMFSGLNMSHCTSSAMREHLAARGFLAMAARLAAFSHDSALIVLDVFPRYADVVFCIIKACAKVCGRQK